MDLSVTPESGGSRRRVVWIVNQYAGSPVHGMEFRHFEIGRELVRLGVVVVVVSGSWSHLYARPPVTTGTYTHERLEGLDYWWVRVPRYERATSAARVWNMVVFALRLLRLPTDRLPQPDAIVVSSPSPFPILVAERWRRRTGARLVFEVRDIWPLTLVELGGLSRRHPLVAVLAWFERRAYRVADIIVSVLPAAEPHLVARGMAASKLRVIPNGVAAAALEAPSGRPPAVVDDAIEQGVFTVGFVGTLGTANALDGLIEAARLLRDEPIRFVIVGHGPDGDRLRSLAADLSNVTFTGPVPKSEVPGALGRFDVCFVGYHRSPLYRFGIAPNKVYDYLAAGRPVILAAEAANDIVGEAHCGETVGPDDPAALAAAIRRMRALSPPERAALGANGRAFVERNHTYRQLARRFLDAIDGAPTDGV
jgi:glycosyltransferase involved in cell wall biosynthesis